jgi:hypothetical protein
MASSNFWQRTKFLWLNAAAICGLIVGFRLSSKMLSANASAYLVVFFLAFFNLIAFVVAPRLHAIPAGEGSRRNVYHELWIVLIEQPAITILFFIQLCAVARCFGSATLIFETASGNYVKGLSNAGSMYARLIGASILLLAVGLVWLWSAIGIWRARRWAWWLAFV